MPSTIRHSAYIGKPKALEQMLQLAFEELSPVAPLLVIPNGESVSKRVEALRRLGFEGAEALHEALGVPAATSSPPRARAATSAGAASAGHETEGGAADGSREGTASGHARRRAPKGSTLQGEMVGRRQELAAAFASRSAAVPLLVTTEHSARGIDFKGIDAVFLVGLPQRVESYIHVAGRTAREGRKGRAVCLLTAEDEIARLSAFGDELGIKVESVDVRFLTGR